MNDLTPITNTYQLEDKVYTSLGFRNADNKAYAIQYFRWAVQDGSLEMKPDGKEYSLTSATVKRIQLKVDSLISIHYSTLYQ